MKGFGLLLMLTLAAVALAICGPPAIAGQNDCQYMQIAACSFVESPATSPALLPVVADPGSPDGLSAVVAINLKANILPAARPRNIFRQGVRLLTFLPCC